MIAIPKRRMHHMTLSDQGYNELERVFHEKDAAWLKERREQLDAQRKSSQQQGGDHWMRCPKCGKPLREENLHGVMIDRCTGCGGIYLDKGELELLARAQPSLLARLWARG
jgi:hypothetical protein